MSNNNENDEIKTVGIGHILRTINNQSTINSGYKLESTEKYKPVTIQHLQESKIVARALERVEVICREMKIVKRDKKHAEFVSKTSGDILRKLGFSARDINLAEIAGYLHDLGYRLDIEKHSFISAGMAYEILSQLSMAQDELDKVCLAIAYHNDRPVNKIGSAVSIAEACDYNIGRLREGLTFEGFSQILYNCRKYNLTIEKDCKLIKLELELNDGAGNVAEQFMKTEARRVERCKEAADFLGCSFQVVINNQII